jgi:hypothetical protein
MMGTLFVRGALPQEAQVSPIHPEFVLERFAAYLIAAGYAPSTHELESESRKGVM